MQRPTADSEHTAKHGQQARLPHGQSLWGASGKAEGQWLGPHSGWDHTCPAYESSPGGYGAQRSPDQASTLKAHNNRSLVKEGRDP